jgi:hypothetical protein
MYYVITKEKRSLNVFGKLVRGEVRQEELILIIMLQITEEKRKGMGVCYLSN